MICYLHYSIPSSYVIVESEKISLHTETSFPILYLFVPVFYSLVPHENQPKKITNVIIYFDSKKFVRQVESLPLLMNCPVFSQVNQHEYSPEQLHLTVEKLEMTLL